MSTVTSQETTPERSHDVFKKWRQAVEAELKGVPFEKKLVTRTFEGIALQPLYGPGAGRQTPQPGSAPFTRGVSENGYGERAWLSCQEPAGVTATAFNATARQLLGRGSAVIIRPEGSARIGLDPDDPSAADAEPGLGIADLEDLRLAFDKISTDDANVHLDAGASPLPFAALYLALARRKRTPWKRLRGSIAADPLGEWVTRGGLPVTLEALFEDLASWTSWSAENSPDISTINVCAAHWHEAGGNAVQELAMALAAGVEYLRELNARGAPPAVVAPRIRFQFSAGSQFFMELAKFRAFRSLWSRVLKSFDLDPAAAWPVVHAGTARWNLSRLDKHVNILRTTTGALSAVLGGVDSLQIRTFDDVAGEGDELSQRISANIHTLLAEEFRLLSPADPAGGAWYVESITDELARKAWALFQDVERDGGFVKSVQIGRPQKLVAATAAEKRDAIDKRRLGIIGTNLFPNLKDTLAGDSAGQVAAIRAQHGADVASRRPRPMKTALPARWPARLREAMAAAEIGASIGQLHVRAYGAAPENAPKVAAIPAWRASEGFEQLRASAEEFAARTGARPRVFLAKMGPLVQHKGRADFSAGFFATAGFESIGKETFETAENAAASALASGASVAVLCSTDETYPELAPAFARAIKAVSPDLQVVLAGHPGEHEATFRSAGFDEFIHIRSDVRGVLSQLLAKTGANLSLA